METLKYSKLPFGIESVDALIQATRTYLQQVRDHSSSVTSDMIAHLSEDVKAKFAHAGELASKEVSDIESELEDPKSLFQFVFSLYNCLIESEAAGISEDEIYLTSPEQARIRRLSGLIQFDLASGSDETSADWWGYPFIQGFLAVTHP